MSKFKKGDKVVHINDELREVLTVALVNEGLYYFEETYCIYVEHLLELATKKHIYTGEWINIDEELPPFGVEIFLFLPEEKPQRQKGSLKYIGEDGLIFRSSNQTNPFATAHQFTRVKGKVVMWTTAPPLPEEE